MSFFDFESEFDEFLEEWQLITHEPQLDNEAGQAMPGKPKAPRVVFATAPQPVNEKEIVKDFGGEFVRDLQKVYTSADVNTRKDTKQADVLSYCGTRYECYKVADRRSTGAYKKVYIRALQGDR